MQTALFEFWIRVQYFYTHRFRTLTNARSISDERFHYTKESRPDLNFLEVT